MIETWYIILAAFFYSFIAAFVLIGISNMGKDDKKN